ncbi:MAG: ABC transporter substrate-binding protein [Acidobacteriota bacterium]
MNRRGCGAALRLLALSALLALLAAACGRPPPRASLVVAVEADPASLDPRLGSDVASDRAHRLLHRGLFATAPDGRPEPDLCEAFRYEDERTLLLTLREGVRFSDGRPVTASDAAATLRSILEDRPPSFRKGDLGAVASVEVLDRRTLRIGLREPFAPLLSVLNFGILPAREARMAHPPEVPTGCGPYRLRGRVRGQWLFFERNPYADPAPRSPTVAFKVVPDPVVRGLELRRGGVDLVVNDLPPDSLGYFLRRGYTVVRSPGSSFAYVGLHCAHPPLDRPEVRRALSLALDRSAIVRHILSGFARPAAGLLPPEHWAAAPLSPPPYGPAEAERLLDGAGLKRGRDGIRFRLSYKTSENKVSRAVAAVLAEQWAAVGVEAEVRWLEWGTFYGDVKAGRFDAFGLTWVGVTDPDGLRLRFASTAFPPEGLNRGRYASPRVDDLLLRGAREGDWEARRALYVEAQRILAEEAPVLPLWHPDAVCVARPSVTGIVLPPDGNFSFLAHVAAR